MTLTSVSIFHQEKQLEATLTFSIRTQNNPKLPTERADGVDFGDIPFAWSKRMRLGKDGIRQTEEDTLAVLTMEIKRFKINRESKVDWLPVLVYLGERLGFSQWGGKTRSPLVNKGQALLGVAQIRGPLVSPPGSQGNEYISGYFAPREWNEMRKELLTLSVFCEDAFGSYFALVSYDAMKLKLRPSQRTNGAAFRPKTAGAIPVEPEPHLN